MATHGLAIDENAYDSLNEGLAKISAGRRGEAGAYKFAVLHLAHFFEHFLKWRVHQQHPLLIYKSPSADRLDIAFTIDVETAYKFLRNCEVKFPADFWTELEWFKRERNRIEHSSFTLDLPQVREKVGRLLRLAEALNAAEGLVPLRERVKTENFEAFDTLTNEFTHRVDLARQAILDTGEKPVDCGRCLVTGVAIEKDGAVVCSFCGQSDPLTECVRCKLSYPMSFMILWDGGRPPWLYMCSICDIGLEQAQAGWADARQREWNRRVTEAR